MKDKISNFADYASIMPGVQQVIGVPLIAFHLVRVIHQLVLENFYKTYTKKQNDICDGRITEYKFNKLSCFIKRKNSPPADQPDLVQSADREYLFDQIAYKNRYEIHNYNLCRDGIVHWRSQKIDSAARLSELGYAIIRFIPIAGTCYSLYAYKTSKIYTPLIPRIACGGDD